MNYQKSMLDRNTGEEFPYDESIIKGKYYYQISVVYNEKDGELQIKPSGCCLKYDDGSAQVFSFEPEKLFPGNNRLSEDELINIMYQLNNVTSSLYPPEENKSVATLRFFGDSLIPEEISVALACEPTKSHLKGQIIWDSNNECEKTTKTGSWRLHATDQLPVNIDLQISELLSKTTQNLEIWASLSSKFEVDLFCGFFMNKQNEEFSISPESLSALSKRGIELSLDIYAPADSD